MIGRAATIVKARIGSDAIERYSPAACSRASMRSRWSAYAAAISGNNVVITDIGMNCTCSSRR